MKESWYEIGKKLGLDKKDLDNILTNSTDKTEQCSYSMLGPYHGQYYGTISIDDF